MKCFCYQDSPRRAHRIAAQGGINAAKNYQNDGDSVYRLFYDTIKGGDFRSREANVYRLAEVSNLHHRPMRRAGRARLPANMAGCSPTARSAARRFREPFTRADKPVSSFCSAVIRRFAGKSRPARCKCFPQTEMLDLVLVDGHAKGIVTRSLVTGKIESHAADAVVLATGGYGNVFYLSTNARGCNVTATYRAYKKGALFANPCFTQIHPTCIPVSGENQSKLTLMSESLRNDGRVWVPKRKEDRDRSPREIPESRSRLLSRTKISELRQSFAARYFVARSQRKFATKAAASVRAGAAFISISPTRSSASAKNTIRERYGNLFEIYEKITGENAYNVPMRIYPAVHYTMGGLMGGLQSDEQRARACS